MFALFLPDSISSFYLIVGFVIITYRLINIRNPRIEEERFVGNFASQHGIVDDRNH